MKYLVGKITQEGTDAPVITTIWAAPGFSISSTSRTGQGEYEVIINIPVLNNDNPPTWQDSNNKGDRYAISQVEPTKITVQSFDAIGEPEDNRLSHNKFEIEVY